MRLGGLIDRRRHDDRARTFVRRLLLHAQTQDQLHHRNDTGTPKLVSCRSSPHDNLSNALCDDTLLRWRCLRDNIRPSQHEGQSSGLNLIRRADSEQQSNVSLSLQCDHRAKHSPVFDNLPLQLRRQRQMFPFSDRHAPGSTFTRHPTRGHGFESIPLDPASRSRTEQVHGTEAHTVGCSTEPFRCVGSRASHVLIALTAIAQSSTWDDTTTRSSGGVRSRSRSDRT